MSLLAEIPSLAPYEPSILALAILCLAVMLQTFALAPLAYLKEEQVPGIPLRGGHELFSFRVIRTHLNSVENLPVFGFSLAVAILAGSGPTLVNALAAIHVVFRLAFWGVYYSGVGNVAGGLRSICFTGGALANLVLIGVSLYSLIA